MKRRASLTILMGLVALVAVGLTSMRVATARLSSVVFGLGLLILLVTTLGALVRCHARARWIGFALFGWAYALALLAPPLREAVAAELPGNGTLDEIVHLFQPPLPSPAEPLGERPSSLLEEEDASGWHFRERGRIVDLTSEERKPWATYLDQRNAHDAREEATEAARRIALTFLGLSFALIGAAAGHALSDRSTNATASPGAESDILPG